MDHQVPRSYLVSFELLVMILHSVFGGVATVIVLLWFGCHGVCCCLICLGVKRPPGEFLGSEVFAADYCGVARYSR